jgi:hypothetical protein
MKKLTLMGIVGILAVVLGTGISNAQKETGGKEATAGEKFSTYEPAKGERINAFMVKNIIGSMVRNMKGEDLGPIQDIVVDIDSGRILYAVMAFEGKLYPVPWQSLAPLPSEGIFFLNVSKARLKEAPSYRSDNLPDMGDLHWGTKVANFYMATRGERYNYGYGYGYNYYGLYPGIAQRDPFAKIFDPESIKQISGEVIKVDHVVPEGGIIAQMEIELIVLAGQKEPVPVFLGPQWYVVGPNARPPFKAGDKVTVTGSWITSQTEPFMIATTVTEGTQTFRLRQKDGTPIWSGWESSKR